VLSQITALQQLSLECHTLEPVALQQLTQLEDLISASRITGSHGQDAALVALLEQLPHLIQLQLSSSHDMPAGNGATPGTAIAVITSSSRLQHLKLHLPFPTAPGSNCSAQLPALRTLEAFAPTDRPMHACATDPSGVPGLAQLTCLQELRLCHCELDADVLCSLTHLSHLALFSVAINAPRQCTSSSGALLSDMQQLQHLELVNINLAAVSHTVWHTCSSAALATTWLQCQMILIAHPRLMLVQPTQPCWPAAGSSRLDVPGVAPGWAGSASMAHKQTACRTARVETEASL
jgi:hypothetical protein